jgi:hypothetical protein
VAALQLYRRLGYERVGSRATAEIRRGWPLGFYSFEPCRLVTLAKPLAPTRPSEALAGPGPSPVVDR